MTWEEMQQSIAAHDRQIDVLLRQQATFDGKLISLTERLDKLTERLDKLIAATANNAETARALLLIVESHQARLDKLDGPK